MRLRAILSTLSAGCLAISALAGDATIKVSQPTGNGFVTVTITRPDGSVDSIPISVTTVMTVEEKRDQIAVNLLGRGYSTAPVGPDGVKILNLDSGTSVQFDPGATGEVADRISVSAASEGHVQFQGFFDPIDAHGNPAVFTAGFIASTGSVLMQVSAEELHFVTDGANVAAALYERLLPEAQRLSVEMFVDDAGLHMSLPPSAKPRQGGVVFGTTSLSPGCAGRVTAGASSGGLAPADAGPAIEAPSINPLGSTLEFTSNTAQRYCVYIIVSSTCDDLDAGDFICVNCPDSGQCSNTIAFVVVNGSDEECRGRWQNANGSDRDCIRCPAGGSTGWRFK
jgi:hypothetical protein